MTGRRTEPTKSLLQGCLYVPAASTDIRKTFARFILEQAKAVAPNVSQLKRKRNP